MPKRHFRSFPPEFFAITDRAIASLERGAAPTGGALLTLDLRQPGAAVNLQMQLRQFWSSLAAAAGDDSTDLFDTQALKRINFAPMLACRYKSGSKTVIEVVHRSQLKYNKVLAEALGTATEPILGASAPTPQASRHPATPADPAALEAALSRATATAPAGKAQEALLDATFNTKPKA